MKIDSQAQPAGGSAANRAVRDLPPAPLDRLGRPLRDLRLSVIDQCNFRCTYCMPREVFGADYPFLPASARLSTDQMVKLAEACIALGVEKIHITGGEPLLRRDLASLIERLARLPGPDGQALDIALTTNGSLLAAKAQSLRDAGLQRVTVSLDALDPTLFQRMSGTQASVEHVLHGIEQAQAVGFTNIKINTVIERGVNDSQILPLVRHFKGTGCTVRFIEYMDVGGANAWADARVLTADETRAMVETAFPLVAVPGARRADTAVNYRHADGSGEVGFIASISQPFCGSCTRARISSDGQLYTCLFATQGVDLKPLLDHSVSVRELAAAVGSHWLDREDRYSEQRATLQHSGRARRYPTVRMSLVGG